MLRVGITLLQDHNNSWGMHEFQALPMLAVVIASIAIDIAMLCSACDKLDCLVLATASMSSSVRDTAAEQRFSTYLRFCRRPTPAMHQASSAKLVAVFCKYWSHHTLKQICLSCKWSIHCRINCRVRLILVAMIRHQQTPGKSETTSIDNCCGIPRAWFNLCKARPGCTLNSLSDHRSILKASHDHAARPDCQHRIALQRS